MPTTSTPTVGKWLLFLSSYVSHVIFCPFLQYMLYTHDVNGSVKIWRKDGQLLISSSLKEAKNHSWQVSNSSIPSFPNTQNTCERTYQSFPEAIGKAYLTDSSCSKCLKPRPGISFLESQKYALQSPLLNENLHHQTRNLAPHKSFSDDDIVLSHTAPWPGK